MQKIIKIISIILPAFLMFFLFATNLFAAVMSSTNYQIQSDDLTSGGGDWSSANYIFRDTFGEVSSGLSDSASYKMKAGWQEMQEVYISVSSPPNAVMKPDIPGMTGGTAATSTYWYVIADSAAGFNMKINASTNPAMQLSGDPTHYFSNYPGSSTYEWNVESGNSQFGYTVDAGTDEDIVDAFLDNGSACGSGTFHAEACWIGFNNTNLTTLINRTSRTNNSPGEEEIIKFQAQSNNNYLDSGSYQSSVTVTVTSN
jgi:hypothetical protein